MSRAAGGTDPQSEIAEPDGPPFMSRLLDRARCMDVEGNYADAFLLREAQMTLVGILDEIKARVGRESESLNAAEEVLTRWAIIRESDGDVGGCGLPEALAQLNRACFAYPDEALS